MKRKTQWRAGCAGDFGMTTNPAFGCGDARALEEAQALLAAALALLDEAGELQAAPHAQLALDILRGQWRAMPADEGPLTRFG